MNCCKNQYLIFNEDGYLQCNNCKKEHTSDEEFTELNSDNIKIMN